MKECVFCPFTQLLPGIFVVLFYFLEARHVDFSLDSVQANSFLVVAMICLRFLPIWNEEGMSSVVYRSDRVQNAKELTCGNSKGTLDLIPIYRFSSVINSASN